MAGMDGRGARPVDAARGGLRAMLVYIFVCGARKGVGGRAWLEDGAGRARVGTIEARKRDISRPLTTDNRSIRSSLGLFLWRATPRSK